MDILVVVDSFKGSLSSVEAGNAVKAGIRRVSPDSNVIVKPLADGGEGTTDALVEGLEGQRINLTVTGPLLAPQACYYGYIPQGDLVIMEMAAAAGITITKEQQPRKATSYGVGEMIRDAVKRGWRNFVIGIGGSATNDGGIGMLSALGFEFLDAAGKKLLYGADVLNKIETIKTDHVLEELKECSFKIACDVTNPLCGENGATYIFGPQKGVQEWEKVEIDAYMRHYADKTAELLGEDYSELPGTGAAGGLGFAFLAYLNSQLVPGIELILEAMQLETFIEKADIVVTGEGRLDGQTAMGKVPVGVAKLAKKYGKKVIAFAGSVTSDARACNEKGIDAFFPVVRGITTLEQAMEKEQAKQNIEETAEQVFRLLL